MKEPGEMLWELLCSSEHMHWPWCSAADRAKAKYAAIESVIRADERAKVGAEIERLRAELSVIDGVVKQIVETMTEGSNAVIKPLREEIEILKSENIRLREALKGVIRVADRDCPEFRAARAALEEEKK